MTVPGLFGLEGELVSLRIAVDPKNLEDLLEALAVLDFPVNPQLYHQPGEVIVEFPAYSDRVDEVATAIRNHGELCRADWQSAPIRSNPRHRA